VLCARVRESMRHFEWDDVYRAGGLSFPLSTCSAQPSTYTDRSAHVDCNFTHSEQEFWSLVSVDGTFLFAGSGAQDVLGWDPEEIVGRSIDDFIDLESIKTELTLRDTLISVSLGFPKTAMIACEMKTKAGYSISMHLVFYTSLLSVHPPVSMALSLPSASNPSVCNGQQRCHTPWAIICQIRKVALVRCAALKNLNTMCLSPGQIPHAGEANVFVQLENERQTSWQYELQQLKIDNQRISEDIENFQTG